MKIENLKLKIEGARGTKHERRTEHRLLVPANQLKIEANQVQARKGFSLVELLVVILILGALAAIAIPRVIGSSNAAKTSVCKSNLGLINRQIEMYYLNTGSWPNNLKDVTENSDYFPDGPPECPFGEKYKMTKKHNECRIKEHKH